MSNDPLLTTLLDLDLAISPVQKLIIGGGYGLYLKQRHIQDDPSIQTFFSLDRLPLARTTEDIDLILRAEIVTDSPSMQKIREALDSLGFEVVETAKFTQFERLMEVGRVKIDLLASPLGEFGSKVPRDPRRVKPRPSVNLHASKLEEAVAVERDPLRIPLRGRLSSGNEHQCEVLIPQAFSYLLMKLFAFRDRQADANKNLGQHHAIDIYRIVGLLTKDEDANVRQLASEFANHQHVQEAARIIHHDFLPADGIGRLRLMEHPLYSDQFDLKNFANELAALFASGK
ncbi:MAG: nucleotidyl transferase AbiEii/AbiGii toxin family protein [Pirellulaceae bacterium]|nr:nucleotidyl transferase AbiEii/AbiGii toxin family protein [Pirellulaceae bacterium]